MLDSSYNIGGRLTGASIATKLEQGSGTACAGEATYLVSADISADGPSTARYEIELGAGQIPAGNSMIGYTNA